jgi:hypothetical protein
MYVEGGGYLFISSESLEVKESVPITGSLKSHHNSVLESTIISIQFDSQDPVSEMRFI